MKRLHTLEMAAANLAEADRIAIVDHLAGYAATELLCYREPLENALRQAQATDWEPWLQWAERRYAVRFARGEGIMPVAQPPETLVVLQQAIAARNDASLVALNRLTATLGSLLLALAVMEGELSGVEALRLSHLETAHQEDRWGEDAETKEALRRAEAEIAAVEKILSLSSPQKREPSA